MTELETMQRAKMYMDKLARGIDPISDQEMPEDSTLNNVRLSRCFFYVSDILGQVIANGGVIGAKPKQKQYPFSITPEQIAAVPISQEPVRVTQLIQTIADTIQDPQMRKLKTTVITDWLMEKGFLEKRIGSDGKSLRLPTQAGIHIGLQIQHRMGKYGEYQAVYYSPAAQRFILDNLFDMVSDT